MFYMSIVYSHCSFVEYLEDEGPAMGKGCNRDTWEFSEILGIILILV